VIFPRLHPRLQNAIAHRLGWRSLRPVQDLAGEALLRGDNAVILAPTAGGKTEAAFFPLLSALLTEPTDRVGVIYISPIKALLNNQAERLATCTEMVGLRRFVWHGDVSASAKERFKREPAEVLMTTPESLEVMLISPRVPVRRLMSDLRAVIVDEVHAMAGQDRGGHLMAVVERIAALSRHDVQRVGLSATVGNPEQILDWMSGSSERGRAVVDPPRPPGRKALRVILLEDEAALAATAGTLTRRGKSLVFCNSRSATEAIAERIHGEQTPIYVHHSSVSSEERESAEAMFHGGESACIVCTSTLELGIDVGDLDRVIQVAAPDTVSSFMQRMGRTGRRPGQAANTTFLSPNIESALQAMALIRLARRGWVESVRLEQRRWPILVHQLLAIALARGGVAANAGWEMLSRVPDLSGISREEYDAVIEHMIAEDFLYAAGGGPTGGVLAMGDAAEKAYGRYNFMELYAVFSSPRRYTVATLGGRSLGSLEQDFVDGLEVGACFLLAGRPWQVVLIHHRDRLISVQPAARGAEPSWGGFAPQFVSRDLCDEVRAVLADTTEPPYLHPSVIGHLWERREQFAAILAAPGRVTREPGDIRWWTFAGGRINATLRLALRQLGGWKVTADNFCVRVRSAADDDFNAVLLHLRGPELWEDGAFWARIPLPSWRLSKFQRALPEWAQQEMRSHHLLDLEGAADFCGADT